MFILIVYRAIQSRLRWSGSYIRGMSLFFLFMEIIPISARVRKLDSG